jgi:hypothetical protein
MSEILNNYNGITRKYMVPAAIKFHFASVARLDDTCQFKEEEFETKSSVWARERLNILEF